MHSLNNVHRFKKIKGASVVLPLLLLAACGSTPSTQIQTTQKAQAPSRQITQAICEGRADEAYQILTAEPLAGPADRFFTALAMERSGRPVAARKLYAALMQAGGQDAVFLNCNGAIIANGPVPSEAAKRLAEIAQDLRAMDATAPLPQKLHSGLPSVKKASGIGASPASSYSGPAMVVYRPQSTSPLGRWFAHLESYKSYQAAQTNKPKVETKFPALKGYIDQWEVSVAGGMVRLGVRLDSQDDAKRLCTQIKSNGAYCAVLDTNS